MSGLRAHRWRCHSWRRLYPLGTALPAPAADSRVTAGAGEVGATGPRNMPAGGVRPVTGGGARWQGFRSWSGPPDWNLFANVADPHRPVAGQEPDHTRSRAPLGSLDSTP